MLEHARRGLLHWPKGRPARLSSTPAPGAGGKAPSAKSLPTLLYGKVDRDTYNLDFQFPLSAYHAFVIAISVTDW